MAPFVRLLSSLSLAAAALVLLLAQPGAAKGPSEPAGTTLKMRSLHRGALVELYSSQGCSSCPPAERLLRSLQAEQRSELVLAEFHVDYWNDLGWTDPFSSAAFSERQRWYAYHDGRDGVFTPEVVVSGNPGLVGSRETQLRERVKQAVQEKLPLSLSSQARCREGTLELQMDVKGTRPKNKTLLFVGMTTQTSATTRVPRGENAGRTLRHADVVRDFSWLRSKQGRVSLKLPLTVRPSEGKLVLFVQQGAAPTRLLALSVGEIPSCQPF